jgi:hypothetical protein
MEVRMHYQVFGRHTGLRVAELVFGAGSFRAAPACLDEVSAIPKTFPHPLMSNREIRQRDRGPQARPPRPSDGPSGLIQLSAPTDDERKIG